MLKKFSGTVLFMMLLLSCASQKKLTSTSASNNDAEIIKQMEYASISAEFRLDTAAIARVIHDNFIAVYPHKLQNKQQELAGIYNNISNRIKEGETMNSLYLDDLERLKDEVLKMNAAKK